MRKLYLLVSLILISYCSIAKVQISIYGDMSNLDLNWSDSVVVRKNDWGGNHYAMDLEFLTRLNMQDIYFIDTGMLGNYLNRFELKDLTEYFAPYKSDYFPYSVESGIDTLGKQRAIPFGIGVGVQYIRKDLMSQAGITKEQLSGTWQDYLQASRTAKDNGFYIIENLGSLLNTYIYSHLNNGEYLFNNSDGTFGLNSDIYVEAYEFIKQFHDEELSLETGLWTTRWYDAFNEDKLIGAVQGMWLTHHLKGWIAPNQIQKFEVIKTPGVKSANFGGQYIIVNPDSDFEKVKPILDMLVGNSEVSKLESELLKYSVESARINFLENYDVDLYGDYFNQPSINSVLKKSIQNMPIIRTHPLDDYAQTLYFTKYFTMVLNDEISPEDALNEINQLIELRLQEILVSEGE